MGNALPGACSPTNVVSLPAEAGTTRLSPSNLVVPPNTLVRFRSFRARLLAVILALVGGAQLAAIAIVATVHNANARREISHDLDETARQFRKEIERGNGYLARTVGALTGDYAFKQIFVLSPDDRATLRSALESFKLRAQPDLVAGLSLDGQTLAETRGGPSAAVYYRALAKAADASQSLRATS
jgi:hypothetical protein